MSPERARRGLLGILALSAALRLALVLGGGQGYWPDENRYLKSWGLLLALSNGDLRGALEVVALSPDHTGFTVLGLLPAAVQVGWMALRGIGLGYAAIADTAAAGALVLACASLASIGLVFGLARRGGAAPGEALLAALLAAASNTLFYYARHLHPYDLSLAFNLWALWLGLGPGRGDRTPVLVGLAAGAGFSTYNGAWLGSGLAAAVHVLRAESAASGLRRATLCAAGIASWPLGFTLLTWPVSGEPLFLQTARFSQLARTQADFAEGWSLPFAFLWDAEHGLALAFGAGAVGAAILALRRGPAAPRAGLWLSLASSIYAALVVFSVGLERIGVFGRQVRQLVPFLCLAAAAAARELIPAGARRRAGPALLAALLLQAGFNFAAPLGQVFPADFAAEAVQRFGKLRREVTLRGPHISRPAFGGALPDDSPAWDPASRFALLNAQHLYPVKAPRAAPEGRVALRAEHPMRFRPYQYEGYTPPERALLRSADFSMRVVELGGAGAPKDPETTPGGPTP